MTDRVDAETMVCREHQIHGCMVCMIDDFWHWQDDRKARRQSFKKAWRETPIDEKYDLGGES